MKPITFQHIALILVLLSTTLTSCKKDLVLDPVTSENYIRCSIAGKQYELNADAGFTTGVDNEQYVAVLGAGQMTGINKNVIAILWGDDEPLSTKIYTDFTSVLPNAKKCQLVQVGYTDETGKTWASWPEEVSTLVNIKATSSLSISSLSGSLITGSFSGLLYSEDFSKSIAVNNGVFRLKKWQ